MSIHLSTSVISCIYLLRSVPDLIDQLLTLESIIVAVLACTIVLVVIAISQIISSLVTCLLLCHDMTHFRYLLIVLIAGTSALQEQVIITTSKIITFKFHFLLKSKLVCFLFTC